MHVIRLFAAHQKSLYQDFQSPKEVTAACLECHTERHREILQTAHWNWEKEDYRKGEGTG